MLTRVNKKIKILHKNNHQFDRYLEFDVFIILF